MNSLDRNYNIAVQALAKINDPIGHIRQKAEDQGVKFDGQMAVQLASNASYLREIARSALREIGLL